jgi:hypothetical protein
VDDCATVVSRAANRVMRAEKAAPDTHECEEETNASNAISRTGAGRSGQGSPVRSVPERDFTRPDAEHARANPPFDEDSGPMGCC